MKPAQACDFLFTGAVILPAFLAYADEPALAAMAFVFLLLAGAVAGIGDPEAPHRLAKPAKRLGEPPRSPGD
jgi:hypothetical protein